jgi:exocyst complex component 4
MRFISVQADESSKRNSERWDKNQRRWTLITTQKQSDPDHIFIPLTEETASAFDGAHKSYIQLSSSALKLLHVELRCLVIHFTLKSMGGGTTHGPGGAGRTFILDAEVNEPDPEVVQLNAQLAAADEELVTHLQQPQYDFIVTGLSSLLDDLTVAAAATSALVPAMNAAGCGRAQLNVLVLQQNLVNVEPGANLRRAALFFDLFAQGPDAVITEVKTKGKNLGYTFGEMKALLTLCYSEALRSDRREVVVAAERGLDAHLLQLSEFLW